MKEITLKEILEMQPQQIVDFLTSLDMQERMHFYNTLLDRHKAFLADQIECVMGAVKFADIAAQNGISAQMPLEELEALAKESNAAAQYYLSVAYLEKWNAEHPFKVLPDDFVNDQPSMEAMRNEWETARRWALDCTELGFKEGFYAQALCYDGVLLPPYYAKKHVEEYYRTYPIVRYEQVVTEKYDRDLALKAACRLGEIYAARERNTVGISSRDLQIRLPGSVYCETLPEVTARLAQIAQAGDVILTVGAGDIYRAGEALLK